MMHIMLSRRGLSFMRLDDVDPWVAQIVTQTPLATALVEAGRGDELDVVWLADRKSCWPAIHLSWSMRPTAIVACTELHKKARLGSASAFCLAAPLAKWATHCIVESEDFPTPDASAAVLVAHSGGRLAVVKTKPQHVVGWTRLMRSCGTKIVETAGAETNAPQVLP